MKTIILSIFTLMLSLFSLGQVTGQSMIYEEYFTGDVDQGATGGSNYPTIDLTQVDWTIDISDAAFNHDNSRFRVVTSGPAANPNQRFEGKALFGTAIWMSPEIDIYSFSDVAFSIYVLEKNSSDNLEDNDTLEVQYKLDNEVSWRQASTNGFYFNDFLPKLTEQEGLNGTTLKLRVIIKNNGIGEWHQFDGVKVFGSPKTFTYTNVWDPLNIEKITAANPISIEGDAVISADITCESVTVNPGVSLTIDSGINLTAASVTLESSSTSYSSLLLYGSINGPVAYKRFVNSNAGGNDLISPPLAGQTWSDFLSTGDNAADLLDNGQPSPTTYAFAPFDKSADWYVNYTSTTTASLVSGTGYRAATDAGEILTFTGTVPTGQVPVTITVETGALTYPEWNLIGNPYPAYMDMDAFLNFNAGAGTNISMLQADSGIYGYDGDASNGWKVFNSANASSVKMTPGQGFLVAAASNSTITFDPSMSLAGSEDDFIAGRDASTLTFLKLNASTSSKDYTTQFYFNDNASLGLDPGYDAKLFGGVAPSFALYSSLVQDDAGVPIALQSLNPSDLTTVTIPLGVNANQGEQLTFTISDTTLPTSVQVYLDDTVAGTSTLLNSGDYTLTPNVPLNGTGRFYLRVSNSTLSTPQHTLDAISIYTNTADNTIVIAGEFLEATTASVYDIQGRVVNTTLLNTNSRSQLIDVYDLKTGIYMVKLQNTTGNRTYKIIKK
jgi:hypothetical protein